MPAIESLPLRLAVALGIGLLIGTERERRKGRGRSRGPAGIRTFAMAALAGALSLAFGGELVLAASALVVGGLAVIAYRRTRDEDPGVTTELALLATFLLGALAVRQPALAGGTGVAVAILLASRARLHRFVRRVLTEQEVHDALLFAAAALVVLPLTPDRPMGPFGAINPRMLWRLVVLVMGISAAGYVAQRALGPRAGLPLSGLAGGFVSSVATIGAMGQRASRHPALRRAAVAGAVLSTVATIVEMTLVLSATSAATLRAVAIPLVFAGVVAAAYGAVAAWRLASRPAEDTGATGRAFDLKIALLFALTVSAVLLIVAFVHRWLGARGLFVAVGLAGFADAHSAAVSAASLAARGEIRPADAVAPILAAMTANTVSKAIAAFAAGGRRFALETVPGLVLVILASWAGMLLPAI